jgi:trk system potassium uptake protein TrkA
MRFVIVGCGRVGSQLAQRLATEGHTVAIVDRDPEAFRRLAPAFRGQRVEGVGFDRDVLIAAGIERADGFASVTSGDNTNVVSARIARHIFHVPRVIARIYDPRRAEIYRRLGIETISPTEWAAGRITELLCHPNVAVLESLGNGEVNIVEVRVSEAVAGQQVSQLVMPGESNVVGLVRDGRATVPTLGTILRAGDLVFMSVLSTAVDRLMDMVGGA